MTIIYRVTQIVKRCYVKQINVEHPQSIETHGFTRFLWTSFRCLPTPTLFHFSIYLIKRERKVDTTAIDAVARGSNSIALVERLEGAEIEVICWSSH